MMIYCQDRGRVTRTGSDIYIVKSESNYQIINEDRGKETVLGRYDNENVADETLKTIFQYLRCKKPCYAMPEGREGAN